MIQALQATEFTSEMKLSDAAVRLGHHQGSINHDSGRSPRRPIFLGAGDDYQGVTNGGFSS